jgi:AraC-like DNA-binding protein
MPQGAGFEYWSIDGVLAVRGMGVCTATPWHSHAHFVLGVIDRGVRHIGLRGNGFEVSTGDGFVLPPQLAHRVTAREATDYRILCFPAAHRTTPAPCGAIRDMGWLDLFDRVFAAVATGRIEGMTALLTATPAVAPLRVAARAVPGVVRRLLRHIADHPEGGETLSVMARACGMSPFHLQRQFVGSVGLSPHQARLIERLRRARALLQTEMPPGETAATCGFADQSHLTREFVRWMGVPPGRYLKHLRADR